MNTQMIEKIEEKMIAYLDAGQRKILHDTLMQCYEEEQMTQQKTM